MSVAAAVVRPTQHGYRLVPQAHATACRSPIVDGRLLVAPAWATHCFLPAWQRARAMWGANAAALADEIAAELAPDMRIDPRTGAERELKRRIELAVALLLNAEGIPTRYPQEPRSPRPLQIPVGPPWYRALLTGWIQ